MSSETYMCRIKVFDKKKFGDKTYKLFAIVSSVLCSQYLEVYISE